MPERLDTLSTPDLDEQIYIEALGRSYDSAFGREMMDVVTGQPIPEGFAPGDDPDFLYYELATSQKDFTSKMEGSASAKGSFGFGKVSAKAKVKQFFTSNSYSCYLLAYRKLVKPRYVINLREADMVPEVLKFITDNEGQSNLIEREMGDQIITGVSVGSELLIKMEIQTSSEEQQKEINASLKASVGPGSGKAKLSTFMKEIKSSKKISFMALGNIPGDVEEFSLEGAENLILNFATASAGHYRLLEFQTRELRQHKQLIGKRIFDNDDLEERRKFVSEADSLYQDYLDWESDILYVIADINKSEFAAETIETARQDLQHCRDRLTHILSTYETARRYWDRTGENGDLFRLGLLEGGRQLVHYPRVVPAVVAPPPSPPAPKPRARRHGRPPGEHRL